MAEQNALEQIKDLINELANKSSKDELTSLLEIAAVANDAYNHKHELLSDYDLAEDGKLFVTAGVKPRMYTLSGTGLYSDAQVREILERYDDWVQVVGNDDVTGFMKSGEE